MNKAKKSTISFTLHVDEVLFHNPSCLSAQYPQVVLILTPITSIPALFTPKEACAANFTQIVLKQRKVCVWGGGGDMKNSTMRPPVTTFPTHLSKRQQ